MDTLFTDVTVFDGYRAVPDCTVLVRDGRIVTLNADPDTKGVERVDGRGRTLLPGLIDSHVHMWAPLATTEAAVYGVTSALDMFSPPIIAAQWERGLPEVGPVTDMRTASYPATAPGGHGTEFGVEVPTVSAPADAEAFVAARIAEGAAYIKIMYDTTHGAERSIDEATLVALVEAAHAQGRMAMAHVTVAADAAAALAAGADVLMHVPVDAWQDASKLVGGVLVPTLTTLYNGFFPHKTGDVLDDRHLRPLLSQDSRDNLHQTWQIPDRWTFETATENVKAALHAGAIVLAGTDVGMPATAPGSSLHQELALLVHAGLTPREAIAAATSAPAAVFGLRDRGRIAPGLRADLLLVDGDPLTDIRHTRRIAGVWIAGQPVNHAAWQAHLAARSEATAGRPAPVGAEQGLVSDFADGTAATRWGAGLHAIAGENSKAELSVEADASAPSGHSLRIDTEVGDQGGFTPAFAGVLFRTSDGDVDGANLSSKSTVTVTARADEPTVAVITVDAGFPPGKPAVLPVELGVEHSTHVLPLAAFGELDRSRVHSVGINAVQPGSGRLHVAELRVD